MPARTKITDTAISRYVECPLKHLYEHRLNLPYKKQSPGEMRRQALKLAALDLYQRMALGETLTEHDAFDLFDARILEDATKKDIDLQQLAPHIAEGRLQMRGMYNIMLPDTHHVLGVNLAYQAPVYLPGNKQTIIVDGVVDVVLERPGSGRAGSRIDMVMLDTRKTRPTKFQVQNDMQCALWRALLPIALKGKIKGLPINLSARAPRTWLLHIESGEQFRLHRDSIAQETMIIWVYNVLKSIKQKIYYPRYSKQCTHCPYKGICTPKHGTMNFLRTDKEGVAKLKSLMGAIA